LGRDDRNRRDGQHARGRRALTWRSLPYRPDRGERMVPDRGRGRDGPLERKTASPVGPEGRDAARCAVQYEAASDVCWEVRAGHPHRRPWKVAVGRDGEGRAAGGRYEEWDQEGRKAQDHENGGGPVGPSGWSAGSRSGLCLRGPRAAQEDAQSLVTQWCSFLPGHRAAAMAIEGRLDG